MTLLLTELRDLPFRRSFLACAERPSFVGQVHFKPSFTHPEHGSGRVPSQRHFLILHYAGVSKLQVVLTIRRRIRQSGNAQGDRRSSLSLFFASCVSGPCPHLSYLLAQVCHRLLLLLTYRALYALLVEQAGSVVERREKIRRHMIVTILAGAAWNERTRQ